MKPLRDGSAIYQMIVDPIELWLWVWVCQHGVGYPDICSQCATFPSEQLEKHLLDSLRTAGFSPWWLESLRIR